ncbi:hypothetical protein MMC17_008235 [Xylographa soralifera]|nr:hypothetical protein [Xylographa soralifera]
MDLRNHPVSHDSIDYTLTYGERVKAHAVSIVEGYMLSTDSKMDGTLHPALNTTDRRVMLDTSLQRWVEVEPEENLDLESFYKDVKIEERSFCRAVEEYQKTLGPNDKIVINLKETHTMEEVWSILELAEQKYRVEDTKGIWGGLCRAFRKLGDHNKAIEGWLGLLPGESEYLSILCGGLKLILSAAERLQKVRDEVFDALREIPNIISSTQRVLAMLKKSKKLQRYSLALYVAILQVLTHILEYFKRKAITKVLRAIGQQSSFERSLSSKLETIRQCSNAFNGEATLCYYEISTRMSQIGYDTNQTTKGMYGELGHVKETVTVMRQEQARTHVVLREIIKANAEERRESAEERRNHTEMNKLVVIALNEVQVLLYAYVEDSLVRDSKCKPGGSDVPTRARSGRHVLLSYLSYDKTSPQVDVAANIQLALTLPLRDQTRSVYVMRSQKLVAWLSTVASATLLVNGHCADVQRRSPLSFVCAKLTDSLQRAQHDNVLSVQFFCGEHVRWQDDPDNTPSGIMNSLLGQLLKHCKHLDVSSVTKLGDFANNHVDAVCKRFKKVLSNFLDTREEDTDRLLRLLIRLADSRKKQSSGCIFKLLLTAPKRLRTGAVENLGEDEILDVPERLPKGGGFTDMQWSLGIGQQLDEMS